VRVCFARHGFSGRSQRSPTTAIFAASPSSASGARRSVSQAARLDIARFDQCVGTGTFANAVKADSDYAAGLDVTGTPTFFVNGRRLTGAHNFDTFVQVIEPELERRR